MKSDFEEIKEDRGVQDIKHEWEWSLFIYSLIQQSLSSSHPVPHSPIGTGMPLCKRGR